MTITQHSITLGEVALLFTGLSLYGRSPVGKGRYSIPYLNTGDLREGLLQLQGLETIQVESRDKVQRYQVQPGDVLLTVRGTSFKSAVCPPELDGAVISANLCAIRLNPSSRLGPYLLQAYLESPEGIAALHGRSQGSATLSIRPKELARLQIPYPSPEKASKLEALRTTAIELRRLTHESLQQQERAMAAILKASLT